VQVKVLFVDLLTVICITVNHATGYASQHIWRLSQATIKWEDGRVAAGKASVVKMGDNGGWSLVSPDGVATTRMVGVSASVIFPCTVKVQKFSSGSGSPGWSRKRAVKQLCVCVYVCGLQYSENYIWQLRNKFL